MSLSRRSFVRTLGAGAAATWVASRGREGSLFEPLFAEQGIQPTAGPAPSIILSSNENPLGCHKDVLAAVRGAFGEAGRYPFATAEEVSQLIAKKYGVKRENVLLGSGSTQILRTATHVFTTKTAGLVAPAPAYEECADYARLMGHPLTAVKLTDKLYMDLDAMQAAAKGAGLVFYCNPNNPVATAISGSDTKAYIAALMKASPTTTVLVDEAYLEYATMSSYETMIPLALENPRVVVARTFSKCYGMAGLRLGFAIGHKDTIAKMADWDGVGNISVLGLAGGRAALNITPDVPRGREEAQRRSPRVHTEVVPGSRVRAHRFADQLHVREHQAPRSGIPRGVPRGRRARSRATSRPTRRRTAASRWARWPRCRRPSRCSTRCSPSRRPLRPSRRSTHHARRVHS